MTYSLNTLTDATPHAERSGASRFAECDDTVSRPAVCCYCAINVRVPRRCNFIALALSLFGQ